MLPVLLGLVGCSGQVVDDAWEGGPYFVVSGPVDASAGLSGTETRGAIAWVWTSGDQVRGRVESAAFEPRLYQYALTVQHPPRTAGSAQSSPLPAALAALEQPMLFGLPLLVEPRGSGGIEIEVDPGALLRWGLDEGVPLGDALWSPDAELAAATSHNLLIALSAPPGVERLAEAPEWKELDAPCPLSEVLRGLTLYRRDAAGCGGWVPLAPAGERTEFQGIAMVPL